MRILVTGAAGFIGSHLTDALLTDGHNVVGFDNLVNGSMSNLQKASRFDRFVFWQGDVLNQLDCAEACRNCDAVYHLACLGVRHSLHSPFENHRVNAEGTLRVLQAAQQNSVKKFFYISTSEVYGKTLTFPIREDALTKPTTVYGASKLCGEHYALAFRECHGMDVTVLRIFNNYGPRAHFEGDAGEVIPRTIIRVLNNQNPVVFGNGRVTRDFFYVKDTARVLTSLLNLSRLGGETINIGTGFEITVKDLIETLLSRMPKHRVAIDFMPDRPADVPRLWVDNTKMRQIIPVVDFMDFEVGIEETIRFYEALGHPSDLIEQVSTTNWQPTGDSNMKNNQNATIRQE